MSNTSWGAQLKGVGGFSSLYKDNRKKVTASAENFRCQKCLEVGHYTYECQGTRKYVSKPSRTVILKRKIEGGKSGGKKKKKSESSSSSSGNLIFDTLDLFLSVSKYTMQFKNFATSYLPSS